MELSALVSKMPLLITIITGDLSQVLVFPLWWPIAVLVIPSQKIGRIDSSGWDGAWRLWAARPIITTASSSAPFVLMVLSRLVQGLDFLGAMRRLGSGLLRPGRVLVRNFLFGVFIYFEGGLMAPRTASIHFSDAGQKVESGFGLFSDGFFDGLLSGVLPTAILLGLGTNKWL